MTKWIETPWRLSVVAFCLAIAGITGCENSDEIGLDITSPDDRFTYEMDTTTQIRVATLQQDSLTSERRTSALAGTLNDPVFGRTMASFLTQLRLSSNEVDFGDDIQVDSVILLLKYKGFYGDTTQMQSFRVFEMQEGLEFDSTYYSNLDINPFYDPGQPIGEIDFYPEPSADSLSIELDPSIGYKILTADTADLKDNDAFLAFFKGLYIQTQEIDETGSICYFDLAGGESRMILYYENAVSDSLSYEVLINSNCTWVGLFDHDYASVSWASQINDSTGTAEQVYLQPLSGLRGHIRMDFGETLLQHAEEGISINKAELIMPVADDLTVDPFLRPGALRVFYAKEDGTNEFIDDILVGTDYHGGFFDEETQTYRFNVTLHVQNLLHPDTTRQIENNGLFLNINDERVIANRIILKNGHPENGMRLAITYTRID